MLKCVYSTDKSKKRKKWIDGFFDRKDNSIVLYNEDKKVLTTSKFKILEDSSLEASTYLIFPDNHEEFSAKFGNLGQINNEAEKFEAYNNNVHNHTEKEADTRTSYMNAKKVKRNDDSNLQNSRGFYNIPANRNTVVSTFKKSLSSLDPDNHNITDVQENTVFETCEKIQGRSNKDIMNLFDR